ncbi:conserved protein of unknown function [Rhodovastum atsumiense]|uniref:Uncharacterized protein n=1 Tax=Rhodovastum atsumiense TaxID=504468 RepID=A0A5M6IP24_9PROT|nr:hypothetical protein [Rhodovastum atsumiense]KAA5609308.1 hypothetical protein F1189_24975 [Rhodovastum atsumiense]CAH2604628.1 conserved protein of unknown function [Rhodovastum atsumiense]
MAGFFGLTSIIDRISILAMVVNPAIGVVRADARKLNGEAGKLPADTPPGHGDRHAPPPTSARDDRPGAFGRTGEHPGQNG